MDINTTSTTNPNPHFMTKPQPFYYGEQMKSWANTPMSYAMDIAIENHFSKVLELHSNKYLSYCSYYTSKLYHYYNLIFIEKSIEFYKIPYS